MGISTAMPIRKPRSNSPPRPAYSSGSPAMTVFPQRWRRDIRDQPETIQPERRQRQQAPAREQAGEGRAGPGERDVLLRAGARGHGRLIRIANGFSHGESCRLSPRRGIGGRCRRRAWARRVPAAPWGSPTRRPGAAVMARTRLIGRRERKGVRIHRMSLSLIAK